MKISITIPVLNQIDYFRQTMDSIIKTAPVQQHQLQIVVVDGGSTDPVETLTGWYKESCEGKIDIAYVNIGSGKGVTIPWNVGLDRGLADGADVICISNSDVVYGEKAILRCAEVAMDHGACFPLSIQGGPKPDNFEEQARERANIGGHVIVNTGGFAGWSFFLSRATIEKIGRFDEQFTLWFQDTSYHWDLRAAGITPWEVRSCLIHHFESVSIKGLEGGFDHKGWRLQDQANFEKKYKVKL